MSEWQRNDALFFGQGETPKKGPYTVNVEWGSIEAAEDRGEGSGTLVCGSHGMDTNEIEWHEPTLKLMLAAPELLVQCQRLLILVTEAASAPPDFDYTVEYNKTKAAIAKATGSEG